MSNVSSSKSHLVWWNVERNFKQPFPDCCNYSFFLHPCTASRESKPRRQYSVLRYFSQAPSKIHMELNLNIQTRSIRREFAVQSEHCKLKHFLHTHTRTHLLRDFIGQQFSLPVCNHRNKQRADHDSSSFVLHFLISSPACNSIAIYFRSRSSLTHIRTCSCVLCACFIPGEESDWSRREDPIRQSKHRSSITEKFRGE